MSDRQASEIVISNEFTSIIRILSLVPNMVMKKAMKLIAVLE
jgi:hypothetical protein